jgi:Glycosyltransferase family 28 C-terminal domain
VVATERLTCPKVKEEPQFGRPSTDVGKSSFHLVTSWSLEWPTSGTIKVATHSQGRSIDMQHATIQLIFFDAGGGHRSAMNAVKEILQIERPQWSVRAVNLQRLFQSVDPVFLATRVKSQDVYNAAIKRGWTRNSRPLLRALQTAIKLHAPAMEHKLIKHWRRGLPGLVVSLIPNFNAVLHRALRTVDSQVPYVTIMTDIADTPPHFWQEPQDQYLICGSSKAYLQARLTGWYRPERVFKTSGMILPVSFYAPDGKPSLTRADLGLQPDIVTTLIMFGGNGSEIALSIVDRLETLGVPVQTIVLCGRNEKVRSQLASRRGCVAVGFTDRVADYMRLADVFIGKPGPGSISEALHMGLPVIVENNARTLVQERYNAVWIEEQGFGIALDSFSEVDRAIGYLLTGSVLTEYKARIASVRNTAVFELPRLFDVILSDQRGTAEVHHKADRIAGAR